MAWLPGSRKSTGGGTNGPHQDPATRWLCFVDDITSAMDMVTTRVDKCRACSIARAGRTATAALLALSLGSAAHPAHALIGGAILDASTIHVNDFGRIDAHYYRGGQPKGRDYADLAALGVKTLINLRDRHAEVRERALTEMAGMRYIQIPMATHQPPTVAQITQFLGIVNDPLSQPVYVHCRQGRHRTGVMTAIYRIEAGWTADQAFKEMQQYQFGAAARHRELATFVYRYRRTSKR